MENPLAPKFHDIVSSLSFFIHIITLPNWSPKGRAPNTSIIGSLLVTIALSGTSAFTGQYIVLTS